MRSKFASNTDVSFLIFQGFLGSKFICLENMMKQKGVCPKCNSKKIGYLENVIQRTEADFNSHAIRGHCPAPLGVERSESEGFLKVIKEGPVGRLEAYICGSCGFYETYIKEPSSIPYESIIGFKWIAPAE